MSDGVFESRTRSRFQLWLTLVTSMLYLFHRVLSVAFRLICIRVLHFVQLNHAYRFILSRKAPRNRHWKQKNVAVVKTKTSRKKKGLKILDATDVHLMAVITVSFFPSFLIAGWFPFRVFSPSPCSIIISPSLSFVVFYFKKEKKQASRILFLTYFGLVVGTGDRPTGWPALLIFFLYRNWKRERNLLGQETDCVKWMVPYVWIIDQRVCRVNSSFHICRVLFVFG